MNPALRLLCLVWALLPIGAAGQDLHAEQGRPYHVQRFEPQDYGGHAQNWAVVQDHRDVIYVANWTGLLEYDGSMWRSISMPGRFARSLATDPSGRVYVGGVGEIGYLAPDSTGQVGYRSLLSKLREEDRAFADIWTAQASEEGIYFQSFDRVMRWDGREVRVWYADTRFHKGFAVNGTYYVRQDDVGLMTVKNGELTLVPRGDRFAQERVDAMLPFGEAALLVTRNEGLLIWRQGETEAFPTEADEYLRSERVYHAAALSDSTYALTTISGTVVLMDREGHVLRVLGQDVGLESDELVLYAYPDHQGGLWLALDMGLLRVDIPTPLTSFGQGLGLSGAVYSVSRIGGRLYASTSQGLFRLQPEVGDGGSLLERRARFTPVGNLRSQVWNVVEAGGRLLAATNDGVYEVDDEESRLVLPGRAFVLMPSGSDPDIVYVGMKAGLALLRLRGGGLEVIDRVGGLEFGEVRSIAESDDGSLWLGSSFGGIVRVWLEAGQLAHMEHYGEAEGLPPGAVTVYRGGDDLYVLAPSRISRVEGTRGRPRFVPHEAINAAVQPDGETQFLIHMDPRGQLWVVKNGRLRVFAGDEAGGYEDVTPPALRLSGIPHQFLYTEPGSDVTWIAGEQGLIRYDPAVGKDYTTAYPALVRRVSAGQDSLIFGGAMSERYAVPEVAHAANNLRFTFSAPTFNASEGTEYQYWLEGFDQGWSRWTADTNKEYTNLPESGYRFRVRARNAQGVVSEEGVFAFEVLPPWYRTWWAYTLYVACAALVIWGSGNLRIRQHRRMLAHEQAVNRRLDTANARLREANERLHQADKLKDDFLANTSHELRTPLTAILGFADVLQEELTGELRSFAVMIRRGGERLLDTVNGLLDMARIQADLIDIQPTSLNVTEEAREILRALEPLAQEKGLFLKVLPETSEVPARMDRFCIERILVNLVGNAIKFTDEGGVTILVDASEEEVYLTVRDTGIGIREEFLPDLFNEFQQQSTGYGRSHEGNGLGLAITRRIVHLLGGDIDVESRMGGGTTFRITLPRYDRQQYDLPPAEADTAPQLPEHTRLLLIEDAERPQLRLRHLLEPRCRLDVVVGAEAGRAAALRSDYDGFLIDGHLKPLPSGEPVLDAIRALPDHADTPAVAVTGFSMPGDRERFLEAGYTGHIGKPFTGRRLLLLLESLLAAEQAVSEEH